MNVGEGGSSGDVDLNLAPIIDCFTVLITYMLVSASFISLTVFDVGVAATGEATAAPATAPTEPPVSLMISAKLSNLIELKLTGGTQNLDLTIPIPARGPGLDFETAAAKVAESLKKYPSIKDATISAEPKVIYKDLAKLVEAIKKVLPKVYLGG